MTGVLSLHGVGKRYRSGSATVVAADAVDLDVAAGEVVAVVGPSGSGKSTLLLLAAGMLAPDGGRVALAGRELSALDDADAAELLRHETGFVFQAPRLLPGIPALDNAALPLLADRVAMRAARDRARPWLERVGLARRMHHRPAALSGGERQRVALARALVHEPRVLFADEPTGSLDSATGAQVLELVGGLCRAHGMAALIATHDPAVTAVADRVLTLRDGRLADEQRPAAGAPAQAAALELPPRR